VAPVFSLLTPEQTRQLAELQGDAGVALRLKELEDKANEGHLSDGERAEYDGYIEACNVVAVLQAEARYRVGSPIPPSPRASQSLADWAKIYEGLAEDQVEAIDRDLNTRVDLTRSVP
jgi:hypothetical protein